MIQRLKGNRLELEQILQGQLLEALNERNNMAEVTPQHQAHIEKLYLDLRLINPDLALSILSGVQEDEQPQYASTGGAEQHVKSRKHKSSKYRNGY